MIKLTAKASDNGGARTYTFFFCYTGKADVKFKSMTTLTTLADDAIEMVFDDKDGLFCASIAAGVSKRVELLQTMDPSAKDELIPLLRAGLCDALVAMNSEAPINVPIPENRPVQSLSLRKRLGKFAGRSLVVAAVLLLGVGIYFEFKPKPEVVASAEASPPDFKDLQEKIKRQITAAAQQGSPAASGIGGQQMDNVALETMKAMGLDPGKANAGCLVGVK